VRAYDAAISVHDKYEKSVGGAFAFQNQPGSGVAFEVLPSLNNDLLVGFAQKWSNLGRRILEPAIRSNNT